MNEKLHIFVSSVQKELEDERVIVQNLVNTDTFLSAHCLPVLYEYEPASTERAEEGCLKVLNCCQVNLLIVGVQYGTLIGRFSITQTEYRLAKANHLPVLVFIKGDRGVKREEATQTFLQEIETDGLKGKYRPCSRNPVLAQCLSYFHRIEERGSGFRRMRDQMIDHGLDQPLLGTDMGYFQVTFPGPSENIERLRVPEKRLLITPAVEAQLNQRQQNIVKYVAEAGSVTTGWCMETMNIVRDTAHRDLVDLVKRGILIRRGLGRGATYVMREGTFDDEIIR